MAKRTEADQREFNAMLKSEPIFRYMILGTYEDDTKSLEEMASRMSSDTIDFQINGTDPDDPRTSIFYTAERNLPKVTRFLLQKGANINYQDPKGRTALMEPSARGHLAIVKLLLEFHANPMLKDKRGLTAVDYANGLHSPDPGQVVTEGEDKGSLSGRKEVAAYYKERGFTVSKK